MPNTTPHALDVTDEDVRRARDAFNHAIGEQASGGYAGFDFERLADDGIRAAITADRAALASARPREEPVRAVHAAENKRRLTVGGIEYAWEPVYGWAYVGPSGMDFPDTRESAVLDALFAASARPQGAELDLGALRRDLEEQVDRIARAQFGGGLVVLTVDETRWLLGKMPSAPAPADALRTAWLDGVAARSWTNHAGSTDDAPTWADQPLSRVAQGEWAAAAARYVERARPTATPDGPDA